MDVGVLCLVLIGCMCYIKTTAAQVKSSSINMYSWRGKEQCIETAMLIMLDNSPFSNTTF